MRKRGRSYYRFYGVLSIVLFLHLFISNQNKRVHTDFKHICQSESESHSVVSDSLRPHGLYSPWDSPSQNTGVVAVPFSRDLSNPGIKPRSPVLQADFFNQLSHKGSPGILQWVVYLQGSFLTQDWNSDLLHCRCVLYQLRYQGSYLSAPGQRYYQCNYY